MKSVRFLALGLTLIAGSAMAQAPGQAPGPTCMQLEGALAQLDRGPDPNDPRAQQAAKMRADLDRLGAQSRSLNCDAPRGGFFIFQGPPRPPQCEDIDAQISRVRAGLASVERGTADPQAQRRQLIIALAQGNCGQQYRAAAQAMAATSAPPRPARARNIFEALFGGPADTGPEEAPGLDVAPMDLPKSSTFRTVCVRTCDGFYFPISYATVPARFATDEALCRRLCPATEAQLFTYRNPGEDIQHASNVAGKPYMSLPTALLYRKQLVPSCSCRGAGQSWSQALSGLEDQSTLQKGDILVTEEQAKEMSQPRPVEVPQQARNRAASAGAPKPAAPTAAPGTPVDPAPSTSTAPLAPAAEQPGQRPVRVISTQRPPAAAQ